MGLTGGFSSEMRLTFFLRIVESVSLFSIAYLNSGLGVIGFSPDKIMKGLKEGVSWSLIFGVIAFSSILILWLNGSRVLDFFRTDFVKKAEEIFWFYAAAGLAGPVAEEIFFRGIVFGYLRRHGFVLATILSTLFFVFAHSSVSVPVTQLIGGLVFCWFYEKTGSLVAPIIIHVTGNMAIFTLGIFQG